MFSVEKNRRRKQSFAVRNEMQQEHNYHKSSPSTSAVASLQQSDLKTATLEQLSLPLRDEPAIDYQFLADLGPLLGEIDPEDVWKDVPTPAPPGFTEPSTALDDIAASYRIINLEIPHTFVRYFSTPLVKLRRELLAIPYLEELQYATCLKTATRHRCSVQITVYAKGICYKLRHSSIFGPGDTEQQAAAYLCHYFALQPRKRIPLDYQYESTTTSSSETSGSLLEESKAQD